MSSLPRQHATSGPRIDPHIVGGEPFTILAWEQWMQYSACLDVDPELFFADPGEVPSMPGVGGLFAVRGETP